jgi:hypothetical protein
MKVKTELKAGAWYDRIRLGLKKGLNVALSKGKKKKSAPPPEAAEV